MGRTHGRGEVERIIERARKIIDNGRIQKGQKERTRLGGGTVSLVARRQQDRVRVGIARSWGTCGRSSVKASVSAIKPEARPSAQRDLDAEGLGFEASGEGLKESLKPQFPGENNSTCFMQW